MFAIKKGRKVLWLKVHQAERALVVEEDWGGENAGFVEIKNIKIVEAKKSQSRRKKLPPLDVAKSGWQSFNYETTSPRKSFD